MPPQDPQAPQQPQVPYGAKVLPSTPDTPETYYEPPPSRLDEALDASARVVGNLYQGFVQSPKLPQMLQSEAAQTHKMLQAPIQARKSGEGLAGQVLSGMEQAPFGIGSMVKRAEQAGPGYFKMEPSTVGAATEGALTAGTMFLAERAPVKMKALREKFAGPLKAEAATEQIASAINPSPKSARGYSATLNQYMHDVVDHAWRQGIDLTDPKFARENLAKALQGAADESRKAYYENYIKPNENALVSTQNIPGYGGGTQTYTTATVGQLDARLSEINATLRPAYERGGATARAAISAESKALLKAEAEAIRNRINSTIGSKMGIDPNKIGQARAKFGALGDAADKTRLSIDRDRFLKNQQKSGIVTDKNTLTKKVTGAVAEKIWNPDRKLAKTFDRLAAEDPVEQARRRAPESDPKKAAMDILDAKIKNLELSRERGSNWSNERLEELRTAREKLAALQAGKPDPTIQSSTTAEDIAAQEKRISDRRKAKEAADYESRQRQGQAEQRMAERRERAAKRSAEGTSWTEGHGRHGESVAQAKQELGPKASLSDLMKRADEIERARRKQ